MGNFIGREHELETLEQLMLKKTASLVVIKGRRRVGKSRLAEEFSHRFQNYYSFTGLAPEPGVDAQTQREEFTRQMREQKVPCYGSMDWGDIFADLAAHVMEGPVLIVLDEITWMAHDDPTFLGKLKIAWDKHFKKNDELILILSGSNSAWIESNILSSTGFFGRLSTRIHLHELPLNICDQFWSNKTIAAYEKFKILSVTGGIPRYLEEMNTQLSAEANIHHLCFEPEGLLFNEFDDIFHDLFDKRQQRYKDIVQTLIDGPKDLDSIANKLSRVKGGDLLEDLELLVKDDFVTRDYTWHIDNAKTSKLSRFRLSDNYLRFYLKYILPNKSRIQNRTMKELPTGWQSIMGLQFENLVINSRETLFEALNIPPQDILLANPFLQTQSARREKCQIDYLIQTKHNVLYLCEIKFYKTALSVEVVKEVERKVDRLSVPKGFSIRKVLVHVNGVTDAVIDSDYFTHIVDFSDLLGD